MGERGFPEIWKSIRGNVGGVLGGFQKKGVPGAREWEGKENCCGRLSEVYCGLSPGELGGRGFPGEQGRGEGGGQKGILEEARQECEDLLELEIRWVRSWHFADTEKCMAEMGVLEERRKERWMGRPMDRGRMGRRSWKGSRKSGVNSGDALVTRQSW